MEKECFTTLEKSTREFNMPEYSGKVILVNKEYPTLTVRRMSDKIAEAAPNRIN